MTGRGKSTIFLSIVKGIGSFRIILKAYTHMKPAEVKFGLRNTSPILTTLLESIYLTTSGTNTKRLYDSFWSKSRPLRLNSTLDCTSLISLDVQTKKSRDGVQSSQGGVRFAGILHWIIRVLPRWREETRWSVVQQGRGNYWVSRAIWILPASTDVWVIFHSCWLNVP